MSDVKIRLRKEPLNVANHHYSGDGSLYLDMPADFELSRTKVVEELTEADMIKFDYVLAFALPKTAKNIALLHNELTVVDQKENYDNVEIDFITGSDVDSTAEMIIDKSGGGEGIQIGIGFYKNHWAKKMKGVYWKDLTNLGQYTHTIKTTQQLHDSYIYNGTDFTWQVLADYGDFEGCGDDDNEALLVPDAAQRPLFSIPYLVDKAFCEWGWRFECPLFENDGGKRLWAYLLDPKMGRNQDLRTAHSAVARMAVDSGEELITDSVRKYGFETIMQNVKGNLKTIPHIHEGSFIGNCEVSIKAEIKCDITELNSDHVVKFQLVRRTNEAAVEKVVILDEREISRKTPDDEIEEFELKADNVPAFDLQRIHVEYFTKDPEAKIIRKAESNISYTAQAVYLQLNEVYEVSELIGQNYKIEDTFKGLTKAFQWKFETDHGSRTVTARSPYDLIIRGDSVEGFYDVTDPIDFDEKVVPDSPLIDYPDKEGPRYIRTAWKESTDSYIKGLNLDEPLYSRLLDRGEDYLDIEPDDRENKFFEPTAHVRMAPYTELVDVNYNLPGISGSIISYDNVKSLNLIIPRMYGGSEEELVHHLDIGPRLLLAQGVIQHGFVVNAAIPLPHRSVKRGNETSTLIPSAYMGALWASEESNNVNSPARWSIDTLDFRSLAIGYLPQYYGFMIYEQMHKRALHEEVNEPTLDLLAHLSDEDFRSFNLRKLYKITVDGKPDLWRVTQIRDNIFGKGLTTPITFVKYSGNISACGVAVVQEGRCMNFPVVNYSIVDNRINLSISGSFNSVLNNAQFYYQELGSQTVVTIPQDTSLTSFVDNLTNEVEVWADTSFDDFQGETCDDVLTPRIVINPCITDQPEWVFESFKNEDNELVVKADIGGQINNTYVLSSVTYNPVGQSAIPYTPDVEIVDVTTDLEFYAEIDFNDACDPIPVTGLFRVDSYTSVAPTASLEYINEFGAQRMNRIGTTPAGDYDDFILYRLDANSRFIRWNEEENLASDYIEARRVLVPIDGVGKPYASTSVIYQV